jgi:ribosome biogenesis protein Nip4
LELKVKPAEDCSKIFQSFTKSVRLTVHQMTVLMSNRILNIRHKTNALLTVLMGTLKAAICVIRHNFATQLATLVPSKTMQPNVQLVRQLCHHFLTTL